MVTTAPPANRRRQTVIAISVAFGILLILANIFVFAGKIAGVAPSGKETYVKLYEQKRIPEAIAAARQSLADAEREHGAGSVRILRYVDALARMLEEEKKLPEAEPFAARALEIREKTYGPADARLLGALNRRTGLLLAQERFDEAEPLSRRAHEIATRILGQIPDDVPTALYHRGRVLSFREKFAEAEPLYRRAISFRECILRETTKTEDHPDLIPLLEALSDLLKKTGREKEAKTIDDRVTRIRAREGSIPATKD